MTGVLLRILIILSPVILYILWLRYTKQKRFAEETGSEAALESAQRQLAWAVGTLVVLLGATFAVLAFTSGDDPATEYVPARVEDGRLIPGGFRPREEPAAPEQ